MIINVGNALPVGPIGPATTAPGPTRAAYRATADIVEMSEFAEALARAAERSTFRIARTRAIRAEIVAGTYETPERINGTVDRLLDVIA